MFSYCSLAQTSKQNRRPTYPQCLESGLPYLYRYKFKAENSPWRKSGQVACHINHFHGLCGALLSLTPGLWQQIFPPAVGKAWTADLLRSSAQGCIRRSVRYWIMYPGSRVSVSDTNVTFACIMAFFHPLPLDQGGLKSLWCFGWLVTCGKGGQLKVKWLRQLHQNILRETNRYQMWARSFPQQLVCDVQPWSETFQEIKATGMTPSDNCLGTLRSTCLAWPYGSLWKCLGFLQTS